MNRTDAILQIIAVEVSNSRHGEFLKAVAKAWQMADNENKPIIKPAWLLLIEKYRLEKEYAEAIETHVGEYLP